MLGKNAESKNSKPERARTAPSTVPVDQIAVQPMETVISLVEKLANTGFAAKRLARACNIYWNMVENPHCTKFFGLAGAMVPVGMQQVIIDFLREGFIDVLVTTGANLTHDLAECLGFRHQQGHTATGAENDADLYDERMNRIYDVFMPNEVYESMEDFVKTLDFPKVMPVRDFLTYLGESLASQPRDSILKAAAEMHIPIFCPAFTDSGLGMQVMFRFQHQGLNLNLFDDLNAMIDRAWDAKLAGVCVIGGGVPKNFIMQAMQFSPASAQYAIQITMDRPEPGGLSGAELREAISWGKVNKNAEFADVICDATIALPILLAYLKAKKYPSEHEE